MNTNGLYVQWQTLNYWLHVRSLEGSGGALATAATREERPTNEEEKEEEEEEEEEAGAVKWHYIDCGESGRRNLF